MVSAETQSILQRKAALGTQEHEARAMSVAKAMRQSIAKLGKELFEMPLSAIGAVTEERKAADLAELMNDASLLCLLEGDDGRVGAAIIGADIVGGLIQQQTMGRVSATNGTTRPMTQTDAAMCAPLLDALFERVAPMLEVEAERDVVGGFSFGARFEDARALDMALDMPEYFVVRLTLDLAGGIRQGELTLVLPKVAPAKPLVSSKNGKEDGASTPQMNEVMMDLPTELNMVLCKVALELAQVKQLAVGEALHLPDNTFPETEIVTETGVTIGSGVLGQVNGMRALRLKRVPVHATQPRRREADLAELDLPEITALPKPDGAEAKASKATNVDGFVVDSGDDLPAHKNAPVNVEGIDADFGSQDTVQPELSISEVDNTTLPELDDFPDLTDVAQVSQVG
jgi:flagellar motor switch protein FliM